MRTAFTCFPATLALILSGAPGTAQAQNGDLTFNGAVTAVTCDVSFDGVIGTDATVTLPTVAAASLKAGQSGGRTPVVVRVSGSDAVCSSDRLSVALNTDRSANLLNGRLRNGVLGLGGGTNAVVGLRDAQDAPIDLTGGAILRPVASVGDVTEFTFFAEYFADGHDVIPGAFQAPMGYTLNYP